MNPPNWLKKIPFRLTACALLCAQAATAGYAADDAPGTKPIGNTSAAQLAATRATTLADIVATLRTQVTPGAATDALDRATAALRFAAELKLPQASAAINEALQLDARNSYFHFFNGFIYHLQARRGDTDKTDLAMEGYRQAIRFDPSNWIAHEFLGLAMWEQRQYGAAQGAFAEALLLQPQDTTVMSRLLAASYMAGDAATACSMAERLDKTSTPPNSAELRSRALAYAACGDFAASQAKLKALKALLGASVAVDSAERRVAQWQMLFNDKDKSKDPAAGMVRTQFPGSSGSSSGGFGGGSSGGFGGSSGGFGGSSGGFGGSGGGSGGTYSAVSSATPFNPQDKNRMVLVDVVMVRSEDSLSTSRGVNLLNALTLQFGTSGGPGFNKTTTDSSSSGSSTVLTRAISVPALAYSLNLANANSNLNEVLARPTLAAVEGLRSEFFSGTSLNAAVVSSGNSGGSGGSVTVERKYGVKLSILPQILPNNMVKLAIDASRTFLKPPSADIAYTFKLEISEILANANVVMRMGDTLILGGLSEKESTNVRDGVPVLQDIPGVQYLFSKQQRSDYQRSVLILITPRPASYTWLSDASKAAIAAEGETPFTPSIDVLRARFSDWFKPYPNLASVFHHMNSADLFREFRTGDVTLEQWDRTDSTRDRLLQALQFLYY